MSDVTPHLGLPLLAAGQAQKHVTHNEALAQLDALVQLACLDKDLTAPPAAPVEGDRYLLAVPAPTGNWAGLAGQVVRFTDGVWVGAVPAAGWVAYIADERELYVFDGHSWSPLRSTSSGGPVASFGINTQADTTNRLAVKADAALFAWDDVTPGAGDIRLTLNKKAAAKDAGFVFQTGWSSRALFGTLGGDDFVLKTSPDGSAFVTALTAAAATGIVTFGASPLAPTPAAADDSTRLATTAYVDRAVSAGGGSGGGPSSTDGLREGSTHLYFTAARARGALSVSGSLAYNAATGVISYTAPTLATVATSGAYADLTGRPSLAAVATSGSAADLAAGTLPAARLPALTGDATSAAGSAALTIAAGTVTNAKLATMEAGTIKANLTGATAAPTDATLSAILDLISATPGAVLVRGRSAWSVLAPGAAGQVLTAAGASAAPAWGSPVLDVVIPCAGKPAAGEALLDLLVVRPFTLPAGLAGSGGVASTAATGSAVCSVTKNGSEVATLTFAAGATAPTLAAAQAVAFAVNDRMRVLAPASQDATLADFTATLVLQRS
jgi:hypothetical protein